MSEAAALRARRTELAARLRERLAQGDAPLAELQALNEHLRLIDAALADSAAPPPRPARPWLPMAGVALLVSLGAAVPMPSTPFSAEIEADAVALQLPQAGALRGSPRLRTVRVEGQGPVTTAHAALGQALARPADGATVPAFALEGTSLRLRQLRWDAPGRLRLDAVDGGALRLGLETATGSAFLALEAAGPTRLDTGRAAPEAWDLGPGEWLEMTGASPAPPAPAAPLVVELGPRVAPGPLGWPLPAAQGLAFVRREDDGRGAARYVSSLRRAVIQLPATGAQVTLQAGDRLQLDGLQLERLDLVADTHLTLRVAGTARVLTSAVGGFERSHLPSVLEFLSRHHTLVTLWAAAGFLWGIGTWWQRTFGKA